MRHSLTVRPLTKATKHDARGGSQLREASQLYPISLFSLVYFYHRGLLYGAEKERAWRVRVIKLSFVSACAENTRSYYWTVGP